MHTGTGFAVIGAGDRGRAYTEAIELLGAGRLVGICDTDETRARKLQQEHGYGARSVCCEEAIDREDVDVVVVCTPAFFHPEITERALARWHLRPGSAGQRELVAVRAVLERRGPRHGG